MNRPFATPHAGRNDDHPDRPDVAHDAAPDPADPETASEPALQGEGNYSATRRHRESLKDFVDAGKVEPAARDAAPHSAAEAQEMKDAEAAGRSHARK